MSGATSNPSAETQQAEALLLLVKQIQISVALMNESLKGHMERQKSDLESVVNKAFPEGDADGHRRHHEAVIKAAEERADFWRTMRKEIAKWGLIGFLGWALVNSWTAIVIPAWHAFLQGPKQ